MAAHEITHPAIASSSEKLTIFGGEARAFFAPACGLE